MKKRFVSSALLAISGVASAQSSVTLFGIVDATVQHGSGSIASMTQLGSGGRDTSRFGLRGVEDLGGGLTAGFWLESQLLVDSGIGASSNTNNQASGAAGGSGIVFNRRATVSVLGSFGELRLGRDYSVQYYNRFEMDPYGNGGVGTAQPQAGTLGGPVNTRVSNAIMYFLPDTIGGIFGEAQYYMGENPSNAGATRNDGNGGGLRIGYRAGPWNASIARARTRYARTATAGDITSTNIGVRYNAAPFSVMGGYYRDLQRRLADLAGRGALVGGIYRIGVWEIKGSWSNYKTTAAGNPETRKLALGLVYNFSKRTAAYGTYARVANSGAATTSLNGSLTGPNEASTGVDLGIRHIF